MTDYQLRSKDSLIKYEAKRDFRVGEADGIPIQKGDIIEYSRGTMVFLDQVFRGVKNMEAAINQEWLTKLPGQKADPYTERMLSLRKKREPVLPKEAPQETMEPRQTGTGVDTLGGVETLPDDWDSLHWTKKRAYIMKISDSDLLEAMADDETDKMKKVIQKRLEILSEGHVDTPQAFDTQEQPASAGDSVRESEADTFIATNFPPASPTKGRGDKSALSSSVSGDSSLSVVFDEV
jgi:hypothetical protein